MPVMVDPDVRARLQEACERGQEQLIDTDYLSAASTLAAAESTAWHARDFDTLARLYLPLQEARRQARQRAGEGRVDLRPASGPDGPDPDEVLSTHPHAQLAVAGAGTTAPALAVRRLAAERHLYVETFLAATYPAEEGPTLVALVPLEGPLPSPLPRSMAELFTLLPTGTLVLTTDELPPPTDPGTPASYAAVMALWERLHAPFLAAADTEPEPMRRMEAYRRTLTVDPACELAHQRLAAIARELARQQARSATGRTPK